MEAEALRDALLETPYYVIDFLPEQVPAEGEGQFFAVERFFTGRGRIEGIYRRFAEILLKLNCYYTLSVGGEGDRFEVLPPEELTGRVIGCTCGGYLQILLPTARALITLDGGDLNMTVYHPSEGLLKKLEPLVAAEGLFLWQPPQKTER